jgi:CHAT domain-containing protein
MEIGREDVDRLVIAIRQALSRCTDPSHVDYEAEPWFVGELARADDVRGAMRAWTALAYKAASELARNRCPRSAWSLARLAHENALHLLPFEPEKKYRDAMASIAVGALASAGEAAAVLGHPLGNAIAVARMLECYRTIDAGDPARVALTVENILPTLIERGRVPAAQALLDSVPASVAAAHPNWPSVRAKTEATLKAPWAERTTRAEVLAALAGDVQRMLGSGDVALQQMAKAYLARMEEEFDPAIILELAKALTELAAGLGDNDRDAPLRIEAMILLRDALDGSVSEARAALPRLAEIEQHFVRLSAWDDVATVRLALGRVFAHVGDSVDAVDRLAAAIDAQARLGFDKAIPALTAGIAESLRPYYEELINVLLDADRPRDALLVAEHCKGELWRRVRGVPSINVATLFGFERSLANMVSWFVTEEGLAIFWGDSTGKVHATRMQISRSRLEAIVAMVRANGWRPVGLFQPSNARALAALSVLLNPLKPMLLAKPESNQPLTFSPDGILHNVPWHVLDVDGIPLIRRHAVHTVLCLDHLLFAERGSIAIAAAKLMIVPAANEHEPDGWRQWGKTLANLLERMGAPLVASSDEQATRAELIEGISGALLHVRCHGHFPEGSDVTAAAAYQQSGLLLADGALPKRSSAANLVTPADLLEARSPANAPLGNVALEACVSGMVHDGAAGDPVGLPWVLALLGARIVVAAHWNVETTHAEAFFTRYYREILQSKRSHAQAHRTATIEVLDQFGPAAAAFRLLGDAR